MLDSDKITFWSELFQNNRGTQLGELEIVEVCYCGVFAISVKNIKRRGVWKPTEKSLNHLENVQVGQYMAGGMLTPDDFL